MTSDDTTPDPGDRETYGDYSVDDEDQPSAEDMLLDGDVADEADRGYSPPERYSPAQGYGNTPWEEAHRETIDQRERQEIPEPDPYEQAESEDLDVIEGAAASTEVGDQRAGRLVDPDEGLGEDTEADLVGRDVGIDGAAASAEEAAVHVVPDDEPGQG
ncbi:DUF5709 domain-containing protein [Nocardioides sp. zg-DK7169]|uniref:DUF5709 domain-containing protein n=1 Tax=Nocardioides sp. zg-DK7169 TaxID=2736600 RepID=UPI001554B985|nr:DUF5709 domain-containing protein [Nocardioides sp. zg-DK7169]NPC97526.1 hypothetical protein [Nocardioides sp. zg-DK7169]